MNKWYLYPKYKALEKCRFCLHPAHFHLNIKNFGMDDQMMNWDRCDLRYSCPCPGFAPEDNLIYLENLNEKG